MAEDGLNNLDRLMAKLLMPSKKSAGLSLKGVDLGKGRSRKSERV